METTVTLRQNLIRHVARAQGRLRKRLKLLAGLATSLMLLSSPVASAQSLSAYYLMYVPSKEYPWIHGVVTTHPPQLRTVGGAAEPPPFSYYFYKNPFPFDIGRYFAMDMYNDEEITLGTSFGSPCVIDVAWWALKIPVKSIAVGFRASATYRHADPAQFGFCSNNDYYTYWTMRDEYHFGAPVRRRAIDGGAFDASPMTQTREGVPWMTYYWGYRLGMVESRSDWDDRNKGVSSQFASPPLRTIAWPAFPTPRENFALTTLPPPFVEGEVTEYLNVKDFPKQPGGQYFYAAQQADRDALDKSPNWVRTQRSFNAGGYVTVCRFYGGGKPGGPNTHFFTADDEECAQLRRLPFLEYEGTPWVADLPTPAASASQTAACRAGTRPLYRAYNNAYTAKGKNDWQSNHRFVTNRADIAAMVLMGWVDEGVVMCVPVLPPVS
jgi:hypothetical protein